MGHLSSRPFVHLSIHSFAMLFDALHNFRNVHATVLKFLIWIYHEKNS